MEVTKKRYVLRFAPCSIYENGRMATWLEDMAQQGYILSKMIGGLAVFERTEPRRLRYQLTDLPLDSFYDDKSPSSQDELIAICEASGWKFIAQRGIFGIFATEDEQASELITDWHIDYGPSIGFLCYALVVSTLALIVPWINIKASLLLLPALLPLFYWQKKVPQFVRNTTMVMIWAYISAADFGYTFLRSALRSGDWWPDMLLIVFFFALAIYVCIGPMRYFIQRQRGEDVNRKKDWKGKAPVYRLTYAAITIILIYLFLHMFDGLY